MKMRRGTMGCLSMLSINYTEQPRFRPLRDVPSPMSVLRRVRNS